MLFIVCALVVAADGHVEAVVVIIVVLVVMLIIIIFLIISHCCGHYCHCYGHCYGKMRIIVMVIFIAFKRSPCLVRSPQVEAT